MRKILVPLDGSQFAEQAIETARAIASRTGAALEFVGVHQPAILASRLSGAPGADLRIDEETRKAHRDYMERIAGAERARSPFEVEMSFREGVTAHEIVARSKELAADLVVMTTHGRGGAGRLLLGSVADRVIRGATIPVLLVRLGEEVPRSVAVPLRKVVVAVAGEDSDDRILSAAVETAGIHGVEYTLTHVTWPLPMLAPIDPALWPAPPDEMAGVPTTLDADRLHAAERYLEWMAGPLRARGAVVATRVVKSSSAPRSILEIAAGAGADLIAVGTAAKAPLLRFIMGSTADRVVRSATCSVLVCPAIPEPPFETRL